MVVVVALCIWHQENSETIDAGGRARGLRSSKARRSVHNSGESRACRSFFTVPTGEEEEEEEEEEDRPRTAFVFMTAGVLAGVVHVLAALGVAE